MLTEILTTSHPPGAPGRAAWKENPELVELSTVTRSVTKAESKRREAAKRKPVLEIGPIPGVLPFTGKHNPLSRSHVSYKSGLIIRTAADNYAPRVALNDSEAEEALKIDALLQPNVYDVECQPVRIFLPRKPDSKHRRSHTYDVRVTLLDPETGELWRKLIYVRNKVSLRSPKSVPRIAEIVRHTPATLCDEIVVVSDAQYSRNYRDNNRRIRLCHISPSPDADQAVMELVNATKGSTRIENIVAQSGLQEAMAWQAIMRMIGAGKIGAERDAVIDYPSEIWSVAE